LLAEQKNTSIAYLLHMQFSLRKQRRHLTNLSGGILFWSTGKAVLGWRGFRVGRVICVQDVK
jgi:hypothetical protein